MRALLSLTLVAAAPVASQDFSAGSEAREWGLYGESKARFEATVVDPLCELAGDCAEACGDGTRQLALMRAADGVMVMPMKNSQPIFTGAAAELAPFCGEDVEVDGLIVTDEYLGAQNLYLVQRIRRQGDAEWTVAARWTEDWAERFPEAAGEGPWFRRDPRIAAEIEDEGYLGLGPEADAAFLEEWFE